jgi:hypothetical protein
LQDYFHGEEEEVGLIVRGGLYEADLKKRRLKACYWPEPSHRIMRGTWFVEKSPDWVPLKVCLKIFEATHEVEAASSIQPPDAEFQMFSSLHRHWIQSPGGIWTFFGLLFSLP